MKKYFLFVLMAACVGPLALHAQHNRAGAVQRPAMERVESLKKVRMMESLKLDENQSVKLFARYNNHREMMHALENESKDLFDKLESQIKANASDAEFNQTFNALFDLDRKKFEARSKFINDLRDVLTTKQVAEYVAFERNFARDLRQAVRDVRMESQKNR